MPCSSSIWGYLVNKALKTFLRVFGEHSISMSILPQQRRDVTPSSLRWERVLLLRVKILSQVVSNKNPPPPTPGDVLWFMHVNVHDKVCALWWVKRMGSRHSQNGGAGFNYCLVLGPFFLKCNPLRHYPTNNRSSLIEIRISYT
jgi:hypothetical protein